jgi:hypothetical protein
VLRWALDCFDPAGPSVAAPHPGFEHYRWRLCVKISAQDRAALRLASTRTDGALTIVHREYLLFVD